MYLNTACKCTSRASQVVCAHPMFSIFQSASSFSLGFPQVLFHSISSPHLHFAFLSRASTTFSFLACPSSPPFFCPSESLSQTTVTSNISGAHSQNSLGPPYRPIISCCGGKVNLFICTTSCAIQTSMFFCVSRALSRYTCAFWRWPKMLLSSRPLRKSLVLFDKVSKNQTRTTGAEGHRKYSLCQPPPCHLIIFEAHGVPMFFHSLPGILQNSVCFVYPFHCMWDMQIMHRGD
jgi:hypothetical protein